MSNHHWSEIVRFLALLQKLVAPRLVALLIPPLPNSRMPDIEVFKSGGVLSALFWQCLAMILLTYGIQLSTLPWKKTCTFLCPFPRGRDCGTSCNKSSPVRYAYAGVQTCSFPPQVTEEV
eukprot:193339-Amphidinium_carterae.1